jgi:hypothetical protein
MHTMKVSRGKQVYVADSKNEIIKFAILIALHIVQYQKQILQKHKHKIISSTYCNVHRISPLIMFVSQNIP